MAPWLRVPNLGVVKQPRPEPPRTRFGRVGLETVAALAAMRDDHAAWLEAPPANRRDSGTAAASQAM
jgi:hypothetical protein